MPDPLKVKPVHEPAPQAKPRGRQPQLYPVLAGMTVGGQGIEINRSLKSVGHYVYRFRVKYGRDLRYIVRETKPGWCRIWRTI